jgi:hypothetical protein
MVRRESSPTASVVPLRAAGLRPAHGRAGCAPGGWRAADACRGPFANWCSRGVGRDGVCTLRAQARETGCAKVRLGRPRKVKRLLDAGDGACGAVAVAAAGICCITNCSRRCTRRETFWTSCRHASKSFEVRSTCLSRSLRSRRTSSDRRTASLRSRSSNTSVSRRIFFTSPHRRKTAGLDCALLRVILFFAIAENLPYPRSPSDSASDVPRISAHPTDDRLGPRVSDVSSWLCNSRSHCMRICTPSVATAFTSRSNSCSEGGTRRRPVQSGAGMVAGLPPNELTACVSRLASCPPSAPMALRMASPLAAEYEQGVVGGPSVLSPMWS